MLPDKAVRLNLSYPSITSQICAGWSLLEILCVLALMAIAGTVWAPAWHQAFVSLSLQQQQQGLLQQIRQAKSHAQQQLRPVTLSGWQDQAVAEIIVYVDTNGDQIWQHDEPLLSRQVYAIPILFSRGHYVRFSTMGTSGQAGSWQLCHADLVKGWKVVLSSSGNVRTEELACHE